MAGRLALGTKVLLGFNQSPAEELGPVAIDRDPRRERVLRSQHPPRHAQPVPRSIFRQGGKEGWCRGIDPITLIQKVASPVNPGDSLLGGRQLAVNWRPGRGQDGVSLGPQPGLLGALDLTSGVESR